MQRWSRLFYYLLLNVLVSACTILVVINWWERTNNPQAEGFFPFTGLPTSSLASPPRETDSPAPATQANVTATPEPVYQTYRVVEYDTFESIAEHFGVPLADLLAANGFATTQRLGPGEVLRIPPVTPTPLPEAALRVQGVLGPGDLASERVVLRQVGEGQVVLSGWTMEDAHGNVFTFPILELVHNDSQVEVYTRAGTNTAGRLYWGLAQAIWQSGETLALRDSTGLLRLTYKLP